MNTDGHTDKAGRCAVLKVIKEKYPQIKIIILTTFDDEYVYNALKYGASGYLLKRVCPWMNLANAITVYKWMGYD